MQMTDRRRFLTLGFGLALAGVTPALALPDETERLQRDIDAAAALGRPYALAPRTIATRGLTLPEGIEITGTRGRSALQLLGGGPLLSARGANRVTLANVTLSGLGAVQRRDGALVALNGVRDLAIDGCTLEAAPAIGLRLEGCGGRVTRTTIRDCGQSALFSLDSLGLDIDANSILRCADNGIQIWRVAQGRDGTRIANNRISAIGARSGGDGQFGNGVSLYRAGGITVSGNQIDDCAFTAVRNNSGRDVIIAANRCGTLGETAIFCEVAFEGCVVQGNLIDGAVSGIQIVNFADHGGKAGACSGNVIRNLFAKPARSALEHGYQSAIKVEGDVAVTGNLIEGATLIGIQAGWGASLRDCAVQGNVVRGAPIGICVSVSPGAGAASVTGNAISGASRAAIAAMEWDRIVSADLARDVGRFAQVRVSGNSVS